MGRNIAMVFIGMVMFVSAGLGQTNVCTYTFNMTTFQFCINDGGTLSSMQLPAGPNLLSSLSAGEGFAWFFADNYNDSLEGGAFPDLGTGCVLSSQPNGPGTLPLIFSCYGSQGIWFTNTVNANAAAKIVTFTLKVAVFPCFTTPCYWYGVVLRNASFIPVQLGNTLHSAFAWSSNALMLTAVCPRNQTPAYQVGTGSFDGSSAENMLYDWGSLPNSFSNTSGSIVAYCRVEGGGTSRPQMKFTYRIPPPAWGF